MANGETRGITIIKATERVAYGIDCAHCTRDALVVTRGGIVAWKSPHGDESHPNAVSIGTLLQWYVSIAGASQLVDMRRIIDEKLEKLAA